MVGRSILLMPETNELSPEAQAVLQHVNALIFYRPAGGRFAYVSEAISDRLGISPEAFVDNPAAIFSDDSRHNQAAKQIWEAEDRGESRQPPPYMIELRHHNGQSILQEVRDRILFDGDRVAGVLSLCVDTSSRLQELEQLERNSQELMVIHHAHSRLMGVTNRKQLLATLLDVSLSMPEFSSGAVYDIDGWKRRANLSVSRGLPPEVEAAVSSFEIPSEAFDGTMEPGDPTTAILLPPGHSWLTPIDAIGNEVCGVLLLCNGMPEGFVGVALSRPFKRETQRLLQLTGALVSHALETAMLHGQIEDLTDTDPLTHFLNISHAEHFLAREDSLILRYKKTASLIVMRFPHMRDHVFDDPSEANLRLKRAADLLNDTTRNSDVLCRFALDEFVCYLPETGNEGSTRLVQRYQVLLDHLNDELGNGYPPVRFDVGWATSERGNRSVRDLLIEARETLKPAREKV